MGSRRHHLAAIASSVVTIFGMTLPVVAAPAETPDGFVRRIYGRYLTHGPGVLTTRPEGAPFYAPALLDEFAKDQEFANGEVRAIDSDPLCSCQDHGDIRVKRVAISSDRVDTATARVTIRNFGADTSLVLTLIRTPAGWRVADVGSKELKSLMAYLQESNAQPPSPPGTGTPATQPSGTSAPR